MSLPPCCSYTLQYWENRPTVSKIVAHPKHTHGLVISLCRGHILCFDNRQKRNFFAVFNDQVTKKLLQKIHVSDTERLSIAFWAYTQRLCVIHVQVNFFKPTSFFKAIIVLRCSCTINTHYYSCWKVKS